MARKLPKSLHTVTVLVNVARYIASQTGADPKNPDLVDGAVHLLGLADLADEYGLADKARAQL